MSVDGTGARATLDILTTAHAGSKKSHSYTYWIQGDEARSWLQHYGYEGQNHGGNDGARSQ